MLSRNVNIKVLREANINCLVKFILNKSKTLCNIYVHGIKYNFIVFFCLLFVIWLSPIILRPYFYLLTLESLLAIHRAPYGKPRIKPWWPCARLVLYLLYYLPSSCISNFDKKGNSQSLIFFLCLSFNWNTILHIKGVIIFLSNLCKVWLNRLKEIFTKIK